jgi:hypothetical protein
MTFGQQRQTSRFDWSFASSKSRIRWLFEAPFKDFAAKFLS